MFISADSLVEHPWPTADERAAFVEHIAFRHSWYKHLSFVQRAPFVVFLTAHRSADASPWFGNLGYAWRIPDEDDTSWRWDRDDELELAPEIVACAGFTLGPFVSTDGNAIDVIIDEWGSTARRERTGYRAGEHELLDPQTRRRIDDLERSQARWEEGFASLDERGRELRRAPPHADDPASVRHFREIDAGRKALYKGFQQEESRHIDDALNRLGLMHATLVAEKNAPSKARTR